MNSILGPDFDKLARGLRRGDQRAAGSIFDQFAPKVFGYFLAKTANRQVAEDLTQETFLKVVSRIGTFDPARGSFPAWLWGIARNALMDHYRDNRTVPMSDLADRSGELPDFPDPQSGSPERHLLAKRIWEIVRTFPKEEQDVLVMHYVSGMRYKEIGAVTGRSEASLRVLIHRLNHKIRDILEP